MPPAPAPAGPWFFSYRARRWLTYRSIRRRLANERARDGWGTSARKAGQIEDEARAAATDIMNRHG